MDQLKKGFSTLEMMMAMAIVVIVASAALVASFGGQDFLVGGRTNVEALRMAHALIEQEQALGRKDFKLVVATSSAEINAPITYQKQVTVTNTTIAGTSVPDYFTKKVTATVSWMGQYGIAHNVSLSALITNFQGAVGGDTCSSILTDASGNHGNWKSPVTANASLATLVGDANVNAPYQITDIDAYQGKLYVTVATSSTPLGPASPSVNATNVTGVGNVAWNIPNNSIKTGSDGNNATASSMSTSQTSNYLRASNFGFTIPPGATILGIKVEVQKSRGPTGSGSVFDSQVKIVRADGTIGSLNNADTLTPWPSSESYISYGNTTNRWNENWTPEIGRAHV